MESGDLNILNQNFNIKKIKIVESEYAKRDKKFLISKVKIFNCFENVVEYNYDYSDHYKILKIYDGIDFEKIEFENKERENMNDESTLDDIRNHLRNHNIIHDEWEKLN